MLGTQDRVAAKAVRRVEAGREAPHERIVGGVKRNVDHAGEVGEVERRVREAEERARQAEERAREAEERARVAEERAGEAERRAWEAEKRAREEELGKGIAEDQAREVEREIEIATREANVRVQIAEDTDQEIGRGGWATISIAMFRGARVAAKRIHGEIISEYNRRMFVREMDMAARIRHPNLVLFVGATVEDNPD